MCLSIYSLQLLASSLVSLIYLVPRCTYLLLCVKCTLLDTSTLVLFITPATPSICKTEIIKIIIIIIIIILNFLTIK
jgi:hypothetical protein